MTAPSYKVPISPVWHPNGEFSHDGLTDIEQTPVHDAARLLVSVARLNGIGVNGIIVQALSSVPVSPAPADAGSAEAQVEYDSWLAASVSPRVFEPVDPLSEDAP